MVTIPSEVMLWQPLLTRCKLSARPAARSQFIRAMVVSEVSIYGIHGAKRDDALPLRFEFVVVLEHQVDELSP